jgi:hypothetical protein
MGVLVETTNPNWLYEYLDRAIRANLCTEIHCTTCGAEQFRLGLLKLIEMQTGLRTYYRLTADAAFALAEALARVPGDFSDPARAKAAIRCILYDAWRALQPDTFQREFVPRLDTSWSGAILLEMQEHHKRIQSARLQKAEYESPSAVVARREKKQRLKMEKHAERLARKAERDRLWWQGQEGHISRPAMDNEED